MEHEATVHQYRLMMSGQQEGSVILVPEHLAGEVSQLMSDFISGEDDTVSGKNIAAKLRLALGQAPGGHDVPLLSSLFALWNALPGSVRQTAKEKLILPAVQALTTAYGLCQRVMPGETSTQDTPEALLRAVVKGLQNLWEDSCGCPECRRCVRGLQAVKPGLFEIPNIIPHTKSCNPVNLLNTLVHKAVFLGGQVQPAYDARGLTPDLGDVPDLDDSDSVLARTLLAALFNLSLFFILRDHIVADSTHLKQALGGHWLAVTGAPLPEKPEPVRSYFEQRRQLGNHFYFPTAGPLNPFHFPDALLRRIVVTDPSVCAAEHVLALVRQGGGAGIPRLQLPALPPAPSRDTRRPCSQATSGERESSRRNLGQSQGTSPAVPPFCPRASPASASSASAEPEHRPRAGFSLPSPTSCPVAPVASPPGDPELGTGESLASRSPPPGDEGIEEFEAWLDSQDASLDDVRREFSGMRVTGEGGADGSDDEGEFSDLDVSDSDHEEDEDGGAAGGGRSLHDLYSLSAV
ncbi:hypothetical protein [macacine gammaherpesvirus 13]|uniref:BRRF2 n=1 Tax=macacine gammaherpesvirus 13 TaxID=2341050 RepID=A0A3G1T4F9_9GAMA|nr:hypothetical protein QKT43_gp42 [Macaca arctoides gammaherpesvirus 1]AYA49827.1 hypothetical protein [Macaca arctoides gammaherpesvirus 1]